MITEATTSDPPAAEFRSVLFDGAEDVQLAVEPPAYLSDLNLDQLIDSLVAGREGYELNEFFYTPLHRVAAIQYRHEVLRDLEKPDVHDTVKRFAVAMHELRDHLRRVAELRHPLQKQSWFVDAVQVYCAAVRSLRDELAARDLGSRGLRGLRDYLTTYTAQARFTELATQARAVKDDIARVRYAVRTSGAKVTVTRYQGEPDYSVEVVNAFAKFRQGAPESHLAKLTDLAEMNHIETQVLEGVATLYPDAFAARTRFCAAHREFEDATIVRFDREVQFYLTYLDLVERCRAAGLSFCYPHVSARSKEIAVDESFDVALADKIAGTHSRVITNDFRLSGPERMFVVTGPNNGGKTTFARMFGQLHHLAGLGLLVPGRQARLALADRIFTHFERAEDIETLRGKFEDELVRVHGLLEEAGPDSVIVMNESFNSTTLSDALFVGTEVVRRILELGCLAVYVTFVDEIASLGEQTVSMVSQIDPQDPASRTFKVIRAPADGRAYAWALAEKYGLSYRRLSERIGS